MFSCEKVKRLGWGTRSLFLCICSLALINQEGLSEQNISRPKTG